MGVAFGDIEAVHGGDAEGGLFPVAELDLAVDEVSEGAGEDGTEFAEGIEAEVGLGGGSGGGGVGDLFAFAEGDGAGGGGDKVETGADGPVTGMEDLGRVVKLMDSAGGEEVGEAGDGFDDVTAGELEDALLGSGIGWFGGGYLGGWGIEERGLIGEEVERDGGEGLDGKPGGEAVEGDAGEALGELEIADHVGDVGVGAVLGGGGGEVPLKLGDGDAVGGEGGQTKEG